MKRFGFLLLFAFVAVVAVPVRAAASKYNVLFIALDDLRPELGCYGHPLVKSPNIDGLAKQGLQFNRSYCQFALCNPSRASLLTGRRPETLQVFDLVTHFRDKNPDVVTLPQLFKQNGYEARSFGKIFHTGNGNHDDLLSWSVPPWHPTGKDPDDDAAKPKAAKKKKAADKNSQPVDPHNNEPPYAAPEVEDDGLPDGQTTKHAVAALTQIKDKPFFLAVGFHRPHMPWVAPKKYWDLYKEKDIALAPNPFLPKGAPAFASNEASELRRYRGIPKTGPIPDDESRKLIHGYYASVSFADAQVGRLLQELDRLKLRDKTIVILWGDHGYQLGEHGTWNKRTDWEIATRAPLLISVPAQKSAGQKTEALVEFVDIYPTLAELCKLSPPKGLEGTSFAPLLEHPNRTWKKAAFSVYHKKLPEMGSGFGRAMRTDRYRFVEWSGASSKKKVFELYDHLADPQENVNVAEALENKEIVAGLSSQLHEGWEHAKP
jgi:iduronate 2-sulfatase